MSLARARQYSVRPRAVLVTKLAVLTEATRYRLCLLGLLAAVPVCADTFVRDDIISDPTPARFSVCSEHTCHKLSIVSLSASQWQQVRDEFTPAAPDSAQERAQIARAVARMESLVGELTGTAGDKGRNFQGVGIEGQLDCIDESTNTTLYLTMMIQDGLVKWHALEDRETRGFFIFGWPHTTAVISDKQTGERFAVDTWFRDNGEPPYILPLRIWEGGWQPAA